MRYDRSFRDEVQLRDGTEVVIRFVSPGDKALLKRGFEALSAESRYRRFFSSKPQLSDQELAYLTQVDGVDHLALGAVTADGARGLGIARFVRDQDDAEVAEPAVAVADDVQNKGLGTLLLEHLVAAAYERGIRRFQCECLESNTAVQQLLRDVAPEARFELVERGLLDVTMPLPEPQPDSARPSLRGRPMQRLFRKVAEDLVSVPLGRRLRTYLERD